MRGVINRIILWTLVAAIGLPPSAATAAGASGRWSRVTALKPDTQVVVTFLGPPGPVPLRQTDEHVAEGWLVSAGPGGLVVHVSRPGVQILNVPIPRERVLEVAVVKDGRPWYVIPVVAAAVVGGAALSLGVLFLAATSGTSVWPSGDDSAYGFLTVFALPVLAGIWAYRRIGDSKRSVKVIYQAPRPEGAAGAAAAPGPPA